MTLPEIFLVRHAPTAANHGRVFMGHADVPAEPITDPESHRVPAGAARTIYSSPLLRARTACEVLFPGEPVVTDPRLMERSVGDWAGLDHATVAQRWPGSFVDGKVDPQVTPPGGESLGDLRDRVAGFLHELASGPGGTCFLVTHNGWIRTAWWLAGELTVEQLFAEPVPFLTPIRFPLERVSR